MSRLNGASTLWPADGEESVPGDGAGHPAGRPPEDPGREGRVGGAGGVLGTPPDRGEEMDPCLSHLSVTHVCHAHTHTRTQSKKK